jgi:hypothetical protein
MAQYDAQFGPEVLNVAQQLVTHGVLDKIYASMAENPTNPLGIREVAMQLGVAGQRLSSE